MLRGFMTTSRIVLGSACIGFGLLYLCVAAPGSLPHIGPPFSPSTQLLSVLIGAAFLGCGVALLSDRGAGTVAFVLSVAATVCAAAVYAPRIARTVHHPDPWTGGAEMLAFGGGTLVLGAMLLWNGRGGAGVAVRRLGELLFALPMIVFGVQHLVYGKFVARLLLPWMPWHLFWAYFVGLAFLAGGAAILVTVRARLAATLLGVMFSLWVVLLHAPLIWSHLHDVTQWTSGLVALAMAGCSFSVAAGAER